MAIEHNTIQQCIESAIETGNHQQFAGYFITIDSRSEIACSYFNNLISKREITTSLESGRKSGKKPKHIWYDWKILPPKIWRSLNFDYTEENLEDNAYTTYQMGKWMNNTNSVIPPRDVLVQCAFSLGLSSSETDILLRNAGYKSLYMLDVVDFVSSYYLDYYFENKDTPVSDFQKRKSAFEMFQGFSVKQYLSDDNQLFTHAAYGNYNIKYALSNQSGKNEIRNKFYNIKRDLSDYLKLETEKPTFEMNPASIKSVLKIFFKNEKICVVDPELLSNRKAGAPWAFPRKIVLIIDHTCWIFCKESEKSSIQVDEKNIDQLFMTHLYEPLPASTEPEQYSKRIMDVIQKLRKELGLSFEMTEGRAQYTIQRKKRNYWIIKIPNSKQNYPQLQVISCVRVQNIVSKSALGENISEDLLRYRNLSKKFSLNCDKTFTEYPTEIGRKIFREITNEGNLTIDKLEKYRELFLYRPFAFFKKNVEFFNDFQAYDKNLRKRPFDKDSWKNLLNDSLQEEYFNIEMVIEYSISDKKKTIDTKNMINQLSELKKNDDKQTRRENLQFQILSFIGNRRSQIYQDYIPNIEKNASKARKTIQGRMTEKHNQFTGRMTEKHNQFTGKRGSTYEMDLKIEDKNDFIKWMIITGHEDQIGIYLRKIGFWEENYVDIHPGNMQNNEYLFDRKDILLIYALQYRDSLLESWFDDPTKRDSAKKQFPFIELLMSIGDTILAERKRNNDYQPPEKGPWSLKDSSRKIYPEDLIFYEPKKAKVD